MDNKQIGRDVRMLETLEVGTGLIKEEMMENWKTSVVGIITGLLGILGAFHVGVPQVVSDNVGLIAAVGATMIGLLAKDGKAK